MPFEPNFRSVACLYQREPGPIQSELFLRVKKNIARIAFLGKPNRAAQACNAQSCAVPDAEGLRRCELDDGAGHGNLHEAILRRGT